MPIELSGVLELRCRNGGWQRKCSSETLKFIIEEEERFVLDDRTTNGVAELIANVGVLLRQDRIFGTVEIITSTTKAVIPAKPVSVEVKLVRSTFCNHVNDRAGVASVLGVKSVGDNTKFLGGLGIGREHNRTRAARNRCVVVVGAIEQEVVI